MGTNFRGTEFRSGHGFAGYEIPQLCGFSCVRICGVRNSAVVRIFTSPAELRGAEFRSCADFHAHGFSWHGIPQLCK